MNSYFINYYGNKYKETKKYLMNYNYNVFDYIVEPFCGIFGFSRCIFHLTKQNCIFLLNDLDTDLINLHKYFKNTPLEQINNDINLFISTFNFKSYGCKLKNYEHYQDKNILTFIKLTNNVMPDDKKFQSKINNIQKINVYKNFFDRCIFYNLEANEFINEVNNKYVNKKLLFFLDPPYFNSSNQSYKGFNSSTNENGFIIDNTQIYIDIINLLKQTNNSVIMIINKNKILDYIYNDYIIKSYDKIYQRTNTTNKRKNKAQHNIILKNVI